LIVAENRRPLVGRILLMSAAGFGLLAILIWAGVIPLEDRSRGMLALAFGMVAVGDAVVGVVMVKRADS
jgi:hypothetical protein